MEINCTAEELKKPLEKEPVQEGTSSKTISKSIINKLLECSKRKEIEND